MESDIKVSKPRGRPKKKDVSIKPIILEPNLDENVAYKTFRSNLDFFADTVKSFQKIDVPDWLKSVDSLKTGIEKTLKESHKLEIEKLENKATEMVRKAVADGEEKVSSLTNKINSMQSMPECGPEFIKYGMFLQYRAGESYVNVWQKRKLVIDKIICQKFTKKLPKKYTKDCYIVAACRKEGGEYKAQSYRLMTTAFREFPSYHSSSSGGICVGDVSEEVTNIKATAENINTAFDKVMTLLECINSGGAYGSSTWSNDRELVDFYTEAIKIKNEEERVSSRCSNCGATDFDSTNHCRVCSQVRR